MNNLDESELTCKLTSKIFLEPVIAEDGYTYEESALLKHFISCTVNSRSPNTLPPISIGTAFQLNNVISPNTSKPMGTSYRVNTLLSKLISELMTQRPQLKTKQYDNIFSLAQLSSLVFNNSRKEAIDYLSSFDKIKLLSSRDDIESYKMLFMNDEICKLLIQKLDNLETIYAQGNKLIHYICARNTNPKILQLLIDAKVDLEAKDEHDIRPIHLVCSHSDNSDMLRVLINAGVNLECEDMFKRRPIHYVCDIPNNTKMLQILIDANVDIECASREGYRPIHKVCIKQQNVDMLELLIKYRVNIESMTDGKHKPIYFTYNNVRGMDMTRLLLNAK
jgi:ankyrin repeat protein